MLTGAQWLFRQGPPTAAFLWRKAGGSSAIQRNEADDFVNRPAKWTTPNQQVAALGDFDGDGDDGNILWRHDNGNMSGWLMDRARVEDSGGYLKVGAFHHVAGSGDVLRRNDDELVQIWEIDGLNRIANHRVGTIDRAWDIPQRQSGTGWRSGPKWPDKLVWFDVVNAVT